MDLNKLAKALEKVYREAVGLEPERSLMNGLILEAYEDMVSEGYLMGLYAYLSEKPYVAERVRDRFVSHKVDRCASVLLVYYLAEYRPNQMSALWPLTPRELEPIFTDIGRCMELYS